MTNLFLQTFPCRVILFGCLKNHGISFISSLFQIQFIVTLSRYNICRAVNSYLGVLAEVATCTCISARWTGDFQLSFWTFTNPIWLLMMNLPKTSLQIVPDQIALLSSIRLLLYVPDWCAQTFLLKN